MSDTGFSYAGSGLDNMERSGGNYEWSGDMKGTNPVSTANSGKTTVSLPTNTLITTDYGFVLPIFTDIVGVRVEFGRRTGITSGTGVPAKNTKDHTVMLVVNNGLVGSNKASSELWPTYSPNNSIVTYAEYGGESDLWGLDITRSQVMSSGFGVAVRVDRTGQAGFIELSDIKIKVYYKQSEGVDINYQGVWAKASVHTNVGGVYKTTSPRVKYKGVWRG